uniref:hypothetical protein n=1 Tax=Treponema endosymbiont of Eucomonympha sp. TaxID=1580831 RepID=UPI001930E664
RSLKSATARRGGQNTVMRGRASGDGGAGVPDGRRAAGSARTGGERRSRPSVSDDGTHYSPFAELLKNRS